MTADTLPLPDKTVSMTAILTDLCALDGEGSFTVGEIVDRFGRRSFGGLLFLFAIPNILPLPPGATAITGLPLLLLAPQVAFGARTPWLPKVLLERRVKGRDMERAFGRILPKLAAVEKLSKPRHTFLFGLIGDRIIGALIALLAFILILPIPLMNVAPTVTIGLFSLGLFNRDGILALAGYGMTLACAGIMVLGAGAIMALMDRATIFFGG